MFGRDDLDKEPRLLTNRQRLARNDVMRFRILGWPITANKIHALKYGTLGVFIGGLGVFHPVLAFTISAILLSFSFGLWMLPDYAVRYDEPEYLGPPIAVLTVRYKPHYYSFSYIVWFAIGFIVTEVAIV